MENYIKEFTEMVNALSDHPSAQILTFNTFAPASESQLDFVESELGYEIDESIKCFYRQSNGLQFRWVNKQVEDYDESRHRFSSEELDWLWTWQAPSLADMSHTGAMMLYPVEMAFLHDWNNILYFDWMRDYERVYEYKGSTYSMLGYHKRFAILDNYSKFYFQLMFLNGDAMPPLFIAEDYGADVVEVPGVSFADYMTERMRSGCVYHSADGIDLHLFNLL